MQDRQPKIQRYTEIPVKKEHRGRGQNFSTFISCPYLVKLGPRQLGLLFANEADQCCVVAGPFGWSPPKGAGKLVLLENCRNEKRPKRVRSCAFGLFSDSVARSLGTLALPRAPRTPCRTLFGLFWGSGFFGARKTSVPGRGGSKDCITTCAK